LANNDEIGIILLAAGSSSRMGKNKLLLDIREDSLLENAIKSALSSRANKVIVVLGANLEENLKVIQVEKVETVTNHRWKKGIGSSIKCGVKTMLENYPAISALIISVCDQPFLKNDQFNSLIEKYKETKKPVIASEYAGLKGVPVLYDQSMFQELLSMPDDSGAKMHILDKAKENTIATVPFPKGELDIDTLDDLKKL
jgi:molybdenum cofactor cytidylyltransferase